MLECDQKKIGENSHFTDKHRWENHGNHHFFQHRRSKEQPVIPDQCRTKKCRVLYTPTTGIANTTEHAYKNVKKASKMGTVRGTNDNQYCRNVWLSNQQQGLYDQEQTAFQST